jgi:hypothetical protein
MTTEIVETFLVPPGKARGCLPRRSKPGEWCPMLRDTIDVIPEAEWEQWTGKISLRPHVKHVLDQDGVGSCATEGATGTVMIDRSVRGLPDVLLNPWFLYFHTSGGRDQGSSIDENLQFLRDKGVASEAVWPRSKGWQAKPSEEAYADALKYRILEFYDITTIPEMVSALLRGWPVCYGAEGHCVVKIEHLDKSKGLDLNSWSTSWGDKGFGVWATYKAVNFNYGAWAVRTTTEM